MVRMEQDQADGMKLARVGQIRMPAGVEIMCWCCDEAGEKIAIFNSNSSSIQVYSPPQSNE